MWTMWGVLSLPRGGDPKIYGIYTSLNQAIKGIQGNDNSFEYDFTEKDGQMIVNGVSKLIPTSQITYIIKEYKVDV